MPVPPSSRDAIRRDVGLPMASTTPKEPRPSCAPAAAQRPSGRQGLPDRRRERRVEQLSVRDPLQMIGNIGGSVYAGGNLIAS